MQNIKIIPWHMGHSGSKQVAAMLSEYIGKRVWRWYASEEHEHKDGNLYINLGSGTLGNWIKDIPKKHLLNWPDAIKNAVNKTKTFQILEKAGIPTVDWTTHQAEAVLWLGMGNNVVCRTKVAAYAGKGIVVAHNLNEIVDAPLYTRFLPNTTEYRVHTICGEVVDVQEKRIKRKENRDLGEKLNKEIRSHKKGWVFCRKDIDEPKDLRKLAIDATAALGLDFAGVDIIYDRDTNKCYVLELNTAPGIEGSTIKIFADAFYKYYKKLQ